MNLTQPSQVKAWCLEHGFHPNRTLGQNFLIDRNILEALLAEAAPAPGERILEIGPGLGVVTEALLAAGAAVTAVEKDGRLADWLRTSLGANAGLTLVESDALDIDLDALLHPPFGAMVSNLPYSVGTRILLDIAMHPEAPGRLVVMVQREVAERFAAGPGEPARGQAGVWLQRGYDVRLLRTVKPTCFWPRPEVSSTLVRLDRHSRHPLETAALHRFRELTRMAFMHRRKQLAALLRHASGPLHLEDEAAHALLAAAGVAPQARPEELSIEQWVVLARAWPTARGTDDE